MTPTDVSVCVRNGFRFLKLFPAGDLPSGYVKSLKGPFSDTNYVAVGGVSGANVRTFLSGGFSGVGIGSSLIPKELIDGNLWDAARERVSRIVREAVL
jgi:2-dehydro-3-deoxyphosphogluconate aldolase/(4S)-4-hydroxy-2-oxoglutarate aldolase